MDESVIRHLEQQQIGTLKLSEAIRIGARRRPQTKHAYFFQGASCALGAAYEGSGGQYDEGAGAASLDMVKWFDERYAIGPDKGREITDMNDRRGMTREQIADWLEAQGY